MLQLSREAQEVLEEDVTQGRITFQEYKEQKQESMERVNLEAKRVESSKRAEIAFRKNDVVRVASASESARKLRQKAAARMKINVTVRNLVGKSVSFTLSGAHTILELKDKIQQEFGVPFDSQRLVHHDYVLANNRLTLFDSKVKNGDLVVLTRASKEPQRGVYIATSSVDSIPEGTVVHVHECKAHDTGIPGWLGRTDKDLWVSML